MTRVSNVFKTLLLLILITKKSSANSDTDRLSAIRSSASDNSNVDLDGEFLEEEEDVESEQNLRCAQDFNINLYRLLKYAIPSNTTSERFSRQEGNGADPNELVQSMLDLEISQIIGPVLRIFGSAVANNATAIDENYNKLPYAVRYQVTDLIKFTVDLLTTT